MFYISIPIMRYNLTFNNCISTFALGTTLQTPVNIDSHIWPKTLKKVVNKQHPWREGILVVRPRGPWSHAPSLCTAYCISCSWYFLFELLCQNSCASSLAVAVTTNRESGHVLSLVNFSFYSSMSDNPSLFL